MKQKEPVSTCSLRVRVLRHDAGRHVVRHDQPVEALSPAIDFLVLARIAFIDWNPLALFSVASQPEIEIGGAM
jgi:hypothetical protein